MYDSGLKEATSNEIEVTDVDGKTMGLMLEYIYKGEITVQSDSESRIKLIHCAEKYGFEKLKYDCFSKLLSQIDNKNAGELAVAAYKYNAKPEHVKQIQDYCLK